MYPGIVLNNAYLAKDDRRSVDTRTVIGQRIGFVCAANPHVVGREWNLGCLPARLGGRGPQELTDTAVGRDEDFSEYVAARWPRLVRSAVLLGCSPVEAEDVVQTALMRCLMNWAKVQRVDDRDAYVHRVLINAFTSSRRRRWTAEKAFSSVPEQAGVDETAAVDDADAIVRSLSRLSHQQRTAVVLRYYVNLSEQQMASVLRVAPGTVKSRLSRALRVLAEDPHLAELGGTP